MRIITDEGKTDIVFRRDSENKIASYSIGISKKTENGYENGYMPVRFRKGIELANMTRIKIKDAFLTFDKWTDKDGKTRTTNYIMVMDFDTDAKIVENKEVKSDPFAEFGKELEESEYPW